MNDMTALAREGAKIDAETQEIDIQAGVRALTEQSGNNSAAHGFHDDWPDHRQWEYLNLHERIDVRRAIAEKLALIHEEVSEALGEIRDGQPPQRIYFLDKKGVIGQPGETYDRQHYNDEGVPLLKPEGFLVELGDAMIRIGDLAFLVGDTDGAALAEAITVKAEYNRTRPHKHGRQF